VLAQQALIGASPHSGCFPLQWFFSRPLPQARLS